MVDVQFTFFDIVVIAVVALSTLLSFFRGFVREVLALVGWVGASIAAVSFAPMVTGFIRPYVGSDMVAMATAMASVFIVALIAISLINAMILRVVSVGGHAGFLDNMLGLVFGVVRGAFIVSLSMLILSLIFNKDHYPDWLEKAHTRPYAERGAEILASIAPESLGKDSKLGGELSKMGEKPADTAPPEGYKDRNIQDLNRLIGGAQVKEP